MRIRKLTAYHIRLPLKRPFSHASHVRQDSDNIILRCELDSGIIGWGEGIPRAYVTGETPETCLAELREIPLADQLGGEFCDWKTAIQICQNFRTPRSAEAGRGCESNALRCAVELSLLDAMGQLLSEPLRQVAKYVPDAAPILQFRPEVRYSTVIGFGGRPGWKAIKMRAYGFRQCKAKVGGNGEADNRRLSRILRWLGKGVDLRVDANESWQPAEVRSRMEELNPLGVSCVEQPCPHEELESLAAVKSQLPIPLMLDESLTCVADAERAIKLKACDLFNIRLSKCGGFLGSLKLAAVAAEAGLGYQLGCHPGESGILSAAGRHWATAVRDIRYLEGSYDRHLFHKLLTKEDVTFGYGGRAPALAKPGLGVSPNLTMLDKVTVRREEFLLS